MKISLIEQQIFENNKKQYLGMWPEAIRKLSPNFSGQYDNHVTWAMSTLKKQDRIVWYLRLVKFAYLNKWWESFKDSPDVPDEIKSSTQRELNKMKSATGLSTPPNLPTIKNALEHFLSMDIHKIQNHVFKKESPDQLMDVFQEYEDEWKDSNQRGIPLDAYDMDDAGVDVILKFDNGMEWLNLNNNKCSIEGQAMGHCGNAGSYNEEETILSLRTRDKNKGVWIPHLTFILNTETGMLGEMKGRGNDKPAARYHPYIVALLKLPMIKGIVGGGYLPAHNFSISDLDDNTREALIKEKPALASLKDLWEIDGEKLTKRIHEKILTMVEATDEMNTDYFGYDSQKLAYKIYEYSISDFIKYFPVPTLESVHDIVTGNEILHYDISPSDVPDDSVYDLFREADSEIIEKLKEYTKRTYGSDEYYEDTDFDNIEDVIHVLQEERDEVWRFGQRCVVTGEEYGAESEMYSAFERYINDDLAASDTIFEGQLFTDTEGQYAEDYVISFYLKPYGMVELLSPDTDLNGLLVYEGGIDYVLEKDAEINDMSEPRYGWSGYDEAAAKERFKEEIDEYLSSEQLKP